MTHATQEGSLVEHLLGEQQTLAAVDRFAQAHVDAETPLLAEHYRELIPLDRGPGEGQQLAFRVDLDKCTGCKACVTACHNLNGLAEEEAWRDVGLMITGEGNEARPQTITTACHHCETPACMLGCPSQAYEKDAITGIVRHLDDQCIGCQYCLLTCPYDAPRFDASRGIVRKCDMCTSRLREGEAPACVQGCPTSAISIEIVETGAPRSALLPSLAADLPKTELTRPTTRYVSTRAGGNAMAADAGRIRPSHGHPALGALLVLVQLSTGILLVDLLCGVVHPASARERLVLLTLAGLAAGAGLLSSIAHLGRPSQMFRAVLGWRTSWMTREILALGVYATLLSGTIGAAFLGVESTAPEWAALVAALAANVCSVQIYATTGRVWWTPRRTASAFAATTVVLGAAALVSVALLAGASDAFRVAVGSCTALSVGTIMLRRWDRFLEQPSQDLALERSRLLLTGPLRRTHEARRACIAAGLTFVLAGVITAAFGATVAAAVISLLGFAGIFIGALVDRSLFFTAEAAPSMPGL